MEREVFNTDTPMNEDEWQALLDSDPGQKYAKVIQHVLDVEWLLSHGEIAVGHTPSHWQALLSSLRELLAEVGIALPEGALYERFSTLRSDEPGSHV
jgi:hypothetical protein